MRERATQLAAARAAWTRVWLAVAIAVTLFPATVLANAVSQALYAKGLIPFNAEHWNEAYQLFEEATRADAEDPLAAYYRGLASARLGFPDAAREEIERALRLWPQLPGAPLDLGILYFDAQQYEKAEPWLQQAYTEPHDRFVAALFLGLSRFRQGDAAGAHQFLTEAAKDPEVRSAAQYYDGLVLVRQRQVADARERFAAVQAERPDSDIGRASAQYLQTGEAPPLEPSAVAVPMKPWSAHAAAAFEYDSNVVLASSEDVVRNNRGIDHQSDGRFVVDAGGLYHVFQRPYLDAALSYDFSQSVHFRLTQYDLQGHRVRLDLAAPGERIQYGLSGWYDFYALDYQTFLQEGVGVPWVTFFEGRVAATQAFYRVAGQDYFRGPLNPFLDGVNQVVGLRQSFLLGAVDRHIDVGYQFDSESTSSNNGKPFDYLGNQVDAEFATSLWGLADGTFGYLFHYEDYEHPNPRNASGYHRRDRISQFLVELTRPLTPSLTAGLWYIGTVDDSNTDEFRYNRNVVHVGVNFAF